VANSAGGGGVGGGGGGGGGSGGGETPAKRTAKKKDASKWQRSSSPLFLSFKDMTCDLQHTAHCCGYCVIDWLQASDHSVFHTHTT